jgi:hypothetical protein
MIFLRYLRGLRKPAAKVQDEVDIKPRVLNVGGGSKDIPLPPHYGSWRHDLLDIDPMESPMLSAMHANCIRWRQANTMQSIARIISSITISTMDPRS